MPKCFSPFAQKDIYHDIYHINYNRIGGLETYPGKFNIKIGDIKEFKTSRTLRKKGFSYTTTNANNPMNAENRKINSGYMTSNEIFDEIIALSNKHKISDEGTETLLKVGKEIDDVSSYVKNKLKEKGPPIRLGLDLIKKPNMRKNKNFNKLFRDIDL